MAPLTCGDLKAKEKDMNSGQANINMEPATASPGHDDVLVKVEGVSKKFCRDLKRSLWYGVCDSAAEFSFAGRRRGIQSRHKNLRKDEFWAVNDVSFELRRGECLGLIGHNGAGKTTLLKMLNGLIKPDAGHITMRGRVGALIALGAGFNPILTGRENIYINGSVLGLSKKEIDGKIDDIIDFAEIGEFIDSPVQNYSSGMQVRLGFSIATALDPDVLILDEVLAVGDATFRAKCFKRIGSIARDCAVIFVSHDQSQTSRICDRALLMSGGRSICHGSTAKVLERYNAIENTKGSRSSALYTHEAISSFLLDSVQLHDSVDAGKPLRLSVKIFSRKRLPVGVALVNFVDHGGAPAGQVDFSGHVEAIPEGRSELVLTIGRVDLAQGNYTINCAIFSDNQRETLVHAVNCSRIAVAGAPYMWCAYKMPVSEVSVSESKVLP